jgi:Domain of unknown function (DUF4167)
MRPGQKNRMRGGRSSSSNNNGGGSRRGPNPLTRSYDSNGPDMKVRGTPQHIAEKYVQLARDAHSSGDTVMAESYLQHAEHYYRIIVAAQNAQQVAYNQANGLPNTGVDSDVADDEDEFEVAGADRFTFRTPQSFQPVNGQPGFGQQGLQTGQPQPYSENMGAGEQPAVGDGMAMEAAPQPFQPRPPRGDRPFGNRRPFEDRGERQDRSERGERPERQDRPERHTRPERQEQSERGFQPERGVQAEHGEQLERGERPERQDRPDRGERGGRRFGRDRQFSERPNNENRAPEDRNRYAPRQFDNGNTEFGAQSAVTRDQPVQSPQQPVYAQQPREQQEMQQPVGLPSFITAPVRPIVTEVVPTPQASNDESEAAPKPRRRRRTAAEMAAAAAGDDAI